MKQQAKQQTPKSIKRKEACFSLLKVGHFFSLIVLFFSSLLTLVSKSHVLYAAFIL